MTNEENKLIDTLADMDNSQMISLSKEALRMNIKQLLVIIAELNLRITTKPVGPTKVLKVESSLPPDPIVVVCKNKDVARSDD